ncbi:MAG: DUF1669 domain-containing protein [Proteobacteria bacterium]|nr:MAG: DUF1669 domain-containing protein [Pseudomonadota bacterium]
MSLYIQRTLVLLALLSGGHLQAQDSALKRSIPISISPFDDTLGFLQKSLLEAKSSIDISIYSLTQDKIAETLLAASERGVMVRLLADFDNTYENQSLFTNLSLQKSPNIHLLRATHFRSANPQSHNKFLIIDNEHVVLGSANLSNFGLNGALEMMLKVDSPQVVEKFRDEFTELWTEAKIVCEHLSRDNSMCEKGLEFYPKPFLKLLRKGIYNANHLDLANPECQIGLEPTFSSLNRYNQIRGLAKTCVTDQKILKTLEEISKVEAFSDKVPISEYCKAKTPNPLDTMCHGFTRTLPWDGVSDTAFFSPEDNPEDQIVEELRKLVVPSEQTYVLLSLTMLSNRFLMNELQALVNRGISIFIIMDENSASGTEGDISREMIAKLKSEGRVSFIKNFYDSESIVSLHHRFVILSNDGKESLILGSANWSRTGFQYSDESLYFTANPSLIGTLKNHFVDLFKVFVSEPTHPSFQVVVDRLGAEFQRNKTRFLVINNVPKDRTLKYDAELYSSSGKRIKPIIQLSMSQWAVSFQETDLPVYVKTTDRDSPDRFEEWEFIPVESSNRLVPQIVSFDNLTKRSL